jgi:hypothetical protein
MLHPIGEFWHELGVGSSERFDPLVAQLGEGAFEDDVAGLPVVEAIERDRAVTATEAAQYALWISLLVGQLEPQYIYRWRGLDRFEAGKATDT